MVEARKPDLQTPPGSVHGNNSATIAPLQFGVMAGGAGFLFGGTSGILRSTRAGASAALTGVSWSVMGTAFSYLRRSLIGLAKEGVMAEAMAGERRKASSLAGGIVGLARGAAQSRRHALPGAIMFSIFGYAGQRIYELLDTSDAAQSPSTTLLGRIADQSWTPVSVLSDHDYRKILDDKKLKLDVEIALIDDRIEKLQQQRAPGKDTADQTPLPVPS